MILNGWEGNPRAPCLAAAWFAQCGVWDVKNFSIPDQLLSQYQDYPTIIMTKSQLQKHAKSLDTSNA
jgi:hypothetical protein